MTASRTREEARLLIRDASDRFMSKNESLLKSIAATEKNENKEKLTMLIRIEDPEGEETSFTCRFGMLVDSFGGTDDVSLAKVKALDVGKSVLLSGHDPENPGREVKITRIE